MNIYIYIYIYIKFDVSWWRHAGPMCLFWHCSVKQGLFGTHRQIMHRDVYLRFSRPGRQGSYLDFAFVLIICHRVPMCFWNFIGLNFIRSQYGWICSHVLSYFWNLNRWLTWSNDHGSDGLTRVNPKKIKNQSNNFLALSMFLLFA
jgi:hypothetical protein